MTVSGTARQGTESHWTARGDVHRLVSMVLLLSTIIGAGSPFPARAAVYQCRDAAGRTVLSNKQSELKNCQVLTDQMAPASMPPDPSGSSEIPPASPYVAPMPPNLPADTQDPSGGSLPPPNRSAPSSPSQLQPCSPGLNPLNPLNNPPCVRSDQSGGKPSEAAPVPSQ